MGAGKYIYFIPQPLCPYFWRAMPRQRLGLLRLRDHTAQDLAEYAVMLAVILVIVIGTAKLVSKRHSAVSPPKPATVETHVKPGN